MKGMTDKQFDAYNRQLLKRMEKAEKLLEGADTEEAKKALSDIMNDLQRIH